MILLYLSVILITMIIYLKRKNKQQSFPIAIAEYIYEKIPFLQNRQKNKEELEMLFPRERKEDVFKKHQIEKVSLLTMIVVIGAILAAAMSISSELQENLQDGKYLIRNTYGKGKKEITLKTLIENQRIEIPLSVEEQKYGEETLERLYEHYIVKLEKEILGENESFDYVDKDLKFLPRLQGYPFQNQWEVSDYMVLTQEGKIREEVEGEEGNLIKITALISYFDWKREYSFYANVFEKSLPKLENFERILQRELVKRSREKEEQLLIPLPKIWEGIQLVWQEKKENQSLSIFILTLCASIGILILKEREVREKIRARKEEMLMDYPEIVTKLTLFMGAGMSVRKIIEKLAKDYVQKNGEKRYAYEEIVFLYNEIERGISEITAYEHFGKRCKIASYMKLGTLLAQNVTKGNSGLLSMLQKEAEETFEERKNYAKKKGEEAGTKLLLPMMLMLMIVMIIVMVPAFFSFQI